ncbi:MAG: transglycosylase domain-containing protein [Bdellovibrionales bacterium]
MAKKQSPKKKTKTVYGESSFKRMALVGGAWLFVAVALFVGYCALTLPDIADAAAFKRKPSVSVVDADGHLIAEYGERTANPITLKDLPKHTVNAVIATEDRRFYSHFGFDPMGFVRGAIVNPIQGRRASGGSTLTQQLAKNLFLTPERTIKRKVQELLLAFWLEASYTKEEILEAYFNRVYFGAGAYGIEAAAHTYFGKSARRLNIRESALLAGLLKAPSRYSPKNDIAEAEARTKIVLGAMKDAGLLSDEEQKALDKLPVIEKHKLNVSAEGRYFADWVLYQTQALVGDIGADVIVHTTLRRAPQKAAETAIETYLEKEGPGQNVGQAAAVLLARDGAVLAMVGGRDYSESQFNRATQALRQPGSAFKPFVYLTALTNGMTPETVFEDAPLRYGKWKPGNYDGEYYGEVTLRDALAYSLNTVAVQVMDAVGVEKTRRMASRMGITSPIAAELSTALGSSVVTPLELTSAYAVIANEGAGVAPYAITEITDSSGKVLYKHRAVRMPQVVDSMAVRQLTAMMANVVDYGTARGISIGRPIAGKTGTSSDYRDAWFVGFTAHQTLAVWVGNDDNKPMKKVTGGGLPARIWRDIMRTAEAGYSVDGLALPTLLDSLGSGTGTLLHITGDTESSGDNGEDKRSADNAPVPVDDAIPVSTRQEEPIVDNSIDPAESDFGALLNRLTPASGPEQP